jgi:hypothetical protein
MADVGEMRTVDAHERLTRMQRLRLALLCVAVFCCGYILLSGPVAWLHDKFAFTPFRTAVEVVFAPVIALHKSGIEPISSFLKWYINIFR